MQLASVVIAAFAALATLVAVLYARSTVHEARLAHRDQVRERDRERLERAAELIEELHENCVARERGFTGHEWQWTRNKLRAVLVGRLDDLPKCRVLVWEATTLALAEAAVPDARDEISAALTQATQG